MYPAEGMHPYSSLSHQTIGGVDSLMIQVPSVMSKAQADSAIQRFPKSVRTGSHGVVTHWTWTIPQTGMYSLVQAFGSAGASHSPLKAKVAQAAFIIQLLP